MSTLDNFNSPEKEIVINVLKEYITKIPLLDYLNIASIIENTIYQEVKEYHGNGNLKCKYTLRFGKIVGLYEQWWENGIKYGQCEHKNGLADGFCQTWNKNGNKLFECYYKEGKKEGVFKRWIVDDKDYLVDYCGNLEFECIYRNNKMNGLYQTWWCTTGEKWYEGTFIEDKKDGLHKEWYEDGQKCNECHFKEGKKHGLYQSWLRDGQKIYEISYIDGKKHGYSKRWNDQGELIEDLLYIEDQEII